MSKIKELSMTIEELRHCGEVLIDVADSLKAMFSSDSAETPSKPEVPAPQPVPLEKVRAVLAEKSVQGRRKEVQALIIKYGAERLSDISPEHYVSLLAEAEALQ